MRKPTVCLFLLCMSGAVLPARAEQSADVVLQEVLVTAQKKSERAQDVPISITAVDTSNLASQGAVQLADYAKSVPGLSFSPQDQGQTLLDIRGISTGRGTNPTVGVTIDDVPFGPSLAFVNGDVTLPDLDPAELAHIEVLKGPQGTLYGASSMGGLVKYVTADPSLHDYNGYVQSDISTVDHGGMGESGRARISGPLLDGQLGFGLSGFWRNDPGYVDDPEQGRTNVNGDHVRGGHATLLWRPSELFCVKLGALIQDMVGSGSSTIDANSQLQPTAGKYAQNRLPGTGAFAARVRLYSAVVSLDLGFAQLTSVTGYNSSGNDSLGDYSPEFGGIAQDIYNVSGTLNHNTFRAGKTTEELRLASYPNNRLEWLLGAFYEKETDHSHQIFTAADGVNGASAGLIYDSSFPESVREYSVFGNATWHVTDTLAAQVGLRYASDKVSYTEHDFGPLIDGSYDVSEVASHDHPTTYSFTLSYKITPDIMTYFREASGYRDGGPNAGASAVGLPESYKSDKTENHEIGIKGSFLDQTLTFDAAAFYINWKDIQLTVSDPDTGFFYFENGGKARSAGVEAESRWQPVKGLTIAANFAYTDAVLQSTLPPGRVGSPGDRLPYSARYAGSLSINQEVPLTGGWIGFAGATGGYISNRLDTFAAAASFVRPVLPAYATLDLRLGAKTDHWKLNAYVINITDKYGILQGHPYAGDGSPTAPFTLIVTRPRTVGLSVGYDF